MRSLTLNDCGLFRILFLLFLDCNPANVNCCANIRLGLFLLLFLFLPQAYIFPLVLPLTLLKITWFVVGLNRTFLQHFLGASIIALFGFIDLQLLVLGRNRFLIVLFVHLNCTNASLASIRRLAVLMISRFASAAVSLNFPAISRSTRQNAIHIYILHRQRFYALIYRSYRRIRNFKAFFAHRLLMVWSTIIFNRLIVFHIGRLTQILHRYVWRQSHHVQLINHRIAPLLKLRHKVKDGLKA